VQVSIALAKRRPVDGAARVSQHYTLVQVPSPSSRPFVSPSARETPLISTPAPFLPPSLVQVLKDVGHFLSSLSSLSLSHHHPLLQVLKDVGGVFEEAGTGETDSGGRLLSEVAMAWMPCAVLIDDEGLAIAAEAAPATLRSTSRRGVVTAEDQTRTPPEPLLTLPVQSSGEGGGRHVPSQEPPTHRLLLVEDSLALQKMLTRFFQRHGYTVTVANNGREGLELLTSQPFHICFMDFLMPVMSGPECMVQYAEWRDGVEEGDTRCTATACTCHLRPHLTRAHPFTPAPSLPSLLFYSPHIPCPCPAVPSTMTCCSLACPPTPSPATSRRGTTAGWLSTVQNPQVRTCCRSF